MRPSLGPMTPLALGRQQAGDGFRPRVVRRAGDRGKTDGREPRSRSLHSHRPRTVEFRPCRAPRGYGDGNGSFHGGVKRHWSAGRQGAGSGMGTGNESPSMTLQRGDSVAKSTIRLSGKRSYVPGTSILDARKGGVVAGSARPSEYLRACHPSPTRKKSFAHPIPGERQSSQSKNRGAWKPHSRRALRVSV